MSKFDPDENLRKVLNDEFCPACGSRGFDRGEAKRDRMGEYSWTTIPAICRNCGYQIEKRRFESW